MIGCYTLLNAGEVVYVGKSKDTKKRIAQHRYKGAIPFDSSHEIECGSEALALSLEEELIERYKPKFNRLANPAYAYPTAMKAGHHITSPIPS